MEKQKCPSVRFKIFNDAWGEKNLANEVSFYSGLTYSPNDITNRSGTLVLRSSNVQNGEISLLDNVHVRPEVAYSQNVDIGDIIVVVRNGSRSLIGKHATIKKNMINTVIGAFMTGVKSSQPDFINALFDSNNFINQVNRNLGATINQITIGAFKEMSFNFPTVEEQTQIGNFFQNLDQSIALQEKKLTQTQNLKKAMLEKMFPKAGSNQPEVRLKGFSGDWEKKLLDKEVEFFSGLTYSPDDLTNKNGTLVLRSSNVQDNQIFMDDNVYVVHEAVNVCNVEVGDIIVVVRNGSRSLIGKHAVINKQMNNTVIGAFMTGVKAKNPYFINALFDTSLFDVAVSRNLGATINQITTGMFKQMEFNFPDKTEQIAIGQFFKQLDETLVLQQQQLQILKNLKQAFLEKMFV